MGLVRSVVRSNWSQLLSAGSTNEGIQEINEAIKDAERDLSPDSTGYISVFQCDSPADVMEVAVALCDVGLWPKNFDYVEFTDEDLASCGIPPSVPSPGDTKSPRVNGLHRDVRIEPHQRHGLILLLVSRLRNAEKPTLPRLTESTVRKAAPNYSWLPADSRLLKKKGT